MWPSVLLRVRLAVGICGPYDQLEDNVSKEGAEHSRRAVIEYTP